MILLVLTSHDRLGDTGHKTGFWLDGLVGRDILEGLLAERNVLVVHTLGRRLLAPEGRAW